MKKVTFVLAVMLLLIVGAAASGQANASTIPNPGAIPAALQSTTAVSAAEGESIARAHVLANAGSYGVTQADLTGLRVTDNYADADTGVRYVYFQQTANGIGVVNGVINVTLRSDGTVVFVGNRVLPGVADLAKTAPAPTLTQSEAIAAAATALGLNYKAGTVTQTESLGGSEREIRYAGGDLSLETIPVKLTYQLADDKVLRLSWDLSIYQQDAQHWWSVRVDAATGDLLSRYDWVVNENFDEQILAAQSEAAQHPQGYQPLAGENGPMVAPQYTPVNDGSSYKVYQIPVESPNHTTPLPPADGRGTVNNPAEFSASPFGWHDTNGVTGAEFTTTQGNNAHAYTDTNADNAPDAGSSPDGGAGLDFAPALDLTLAPSGYRPAAVVNLFYWNNLMHDIPYQHGFNEAAGNFQENNYGEGGAGSDYVYAEAQDGSGTNNANFGTPADGGNPRMQMYVWTAPTPDKDGDFDSGIIAHEYGHGISNRLVGGPANVSCLQNSEQMGEGWSDWQAIMLTQKASDTGTTNRGMGTYVLDQPITGNGIRAFPYNTNMAVDPRTYQDTRTAAVPHGVGSIWTAIIWEVNWALIGQYGYNPDLYQPWNTAGNHGNNLAYRLIQDGMKNTVCNPGFVNARDAILAADVTLTGGVNRCTLWTAFAKRGLGANAVQGSSGSNSDNTNGFNLPGDCGGPTPTVSPTASATPDGAFCVNTPLTIPDSGTASNVLNVSTSGTISDLNVQLNVTHTFVGDLSFNLSHNAVSAELYDRPGVPATTFGCSGDNFVATADDEGATSFEAACTTGTPAFPVGNYIPGDPAGPNLAAFDGQNVNGAWTMTAADGAGGDTGTLNSWCLIPTLSGGPTSTATATSQATATATPSVTATGSVPPATATATATPGTGGTYCSTGVLTIPDSVPAGVTSVINVADSATIGDLNVSLDVTHTFVGDLAFSLSHGATTAELYDRPGVPATTFGCSGDNFVATADDEGATSFEAACTTGTPAFPVGNYIPGDPAGPNLAAFDGQNINGAWTLTASDNAGGDTGTLNQWCLITGGGGPGPTATPTVSPTPGGSAPDINVSPGSVTETHNTPPQTTNRTLTIGNTGNAPLTWTITEDNGPVPNPVMPRDPNAVPERLTNNVSVKGNPSSSLGDIVGDGSFETGSPNASWEEFSANFGTPLCTVAGCGTGTGTGPRTGEWWAWFGGINAQETGAVTQTVTIPNGTAELAFWLEMPVVDNDAFLSVRLDGEEVFRAEETTTGYTTYAEVTVDISDYADGGAHELSFYSEQSAGANVTNIFVDDVSITAEGGGPACAAPSDIPWLTVSPTNGTTAPGGSSNVTLTFNSTGLVPGAYTGTLCVESNDPDENPVEVPVTLNVGPATAVTLGSLTQATGDIRIADFAAAGILLLAGATLLFRRRK